MLQWKANFPPISGIVFDSIQDHVWWILFKERVQSRWCSGGTHVYFGLHLLVALLGDLEVSFLHIRTLLRVERVGDGSEHKYIQLDSFLPLLLLLFVLGLKNMHSIFLAILHLLSGAGEVYHTTCIFQLRFLWCLT